MSKSKLILITGLPFSGKTTKAIKIIQDSKEIFLRVSPKDFKSLHFPGFDPNSIQSVYIFNGLKFLIGQYISKMKLSVVVDCDSLDPVDVSRYKLIAQINKATFEHINLETSMDECIERAKKANKNSEIPNIINTALKYKLYKTEIDKPFHIVEITKKSQINEATIKDMETAATEGKDIILISCLKEKKRAEVQDWLIQAKVFAMGLPINTLIMAPNELKKTNHESIKRWIIETYNLIKQPESQK